MKQMGKQHSSRSLRLAEKGIGHIGGTKYMIMGTEGRHQQGEGVRADIL